MLQMLGKLELYLYLGAVKNCSFWSEPRGSRTDNRVHHEKFYPPTKAGACSPCFHETRRRVRVCLFV